MTVEPTRDDATARWRRVEALFHRALDEAPEKRAALLGAAAADDDPSVLAEVESLLTALDGTTAFAEDAGSRLAARLASERTKVSAEASPETSPEASPDGSVGAQIGPYRLLEHIGEGGMGVVFLAEQSEPLPRRVALKIMTPRAPRHDALRRFDLEREALARMSHPTIAQVYGASTTDDGIAYIAMEHVPGTPITRHCDENRLDLRRRVELFVTVCEGVRHAHERGVIHRDLKPSNLLVTEIDGEPAAKIIDFGIAKAFGSWARKSEAHTSSAQRVGSLHYLGPEVFADPRAIDPRSDVYALGVVLSELLAGVRPLENPLTQLPLGGGTRDRRPPERSMRPSVRLRSLAPQAQRRIAACRRFDGDAAASRLASRLADELDWIVVRAVAVDPSDRYRSVADLAADLERWLGGFPVEARPSDTLYRLRKAVRRHLLAASVVLLVASTAIGLGVRTRLLSERAEQARIEAQHLVAFMIDDLSRQLEPMGRLDLLESVSRESLEYYESSAGFDDSDPGPSAALRQIGEVFASRGDLEAARDSWRRALALDLARLQSSKAPVEPTIAAARDLTLLGQLFGDLGERDEAIAFLERAEGMLQRLTAPRVEEAAAVELALARTLTTYSELRRHQDEGEAAVRTSREAIDRLERTADRGVGGVDRVEILDALADARYILGLTQLYSLGDARAAARSFEAAEKTYRALSIDRPDEAVWRFRRAVMLGQGLSTTYLALDRLEASLEVNRLALDLYEQITLDEPGNAHWAHGFAWEWVRRGQVEQRLGRFVEAVRSFENAETLQSRWIERTVDAPLAWLDALAIAREGQALARLAQGDAEGASRDADAALETRRRLVARDPENLFGRLALATTGVLVVELRLERGDLVGAREAFIDATDMLEPFGENLSDRAAAAGVAETRRRLEVARRALAPNDLEP